MVTRCCIEIVNRDNRYRIYRHLDGHPAGVLADIRLVLNKTRCGRERGISDYEYFLANLIFYAKLSTFEAYKDTERFWLREWEYTYGVCSHDCEHDDLDYRYIIYVQSRTIEIQERDRSNGGFVTIFNGSLDEAFTRFVHGSEFEHGCHISERLLDVIIDQVAKSMIKQPSGVLDRVRKALSRLRAMKTFVKMEWGHCRLCLEAGLVHLHDDWRLQYACYICNSLYCDKHICAHLERRIYET